MVDFGRDFSRTLVKAQAIDIMMAWVTKNRRINKLVFLIINNLLKHIYNILIMDKTTPKLQCLQFRINHYMFKQQIIVYSK